MIAKFHFPGSKYNCTQCWCFISTFILYICCVITVVLSTVTVKPTIISIFVNGSFKYFFTIPMVYYNFVTAWTYVANWYVFSPFAFKQNCFCVIAKLRTMAMFHSILVLTNIATISDWIIMLSCFISICSI